jgi:hypothetical protein
LGFRVWKTCFGTLPLTATLPLKPALQPQKANGRKNSRRGILLTQPVPLRAARGRECGIELPWQHGQVEPVGAGQGLLEGTGVGGMRIAPKVAARLRRVWALRRTWSESPAAMAS